MLHCLPTFSSQVPQVPQVPLQAQDYLSGQALLDFLKALANCFEILRRNPRVLLQVVGPEVDAQDVFGKLREWFFP
jgi:hypothetical protein